MINEMKTYFRRWKRKCVCKWDIRKAVVQCYNAGFSEPLDLENPTTINEKLQYLKLNQYYNNPLITMCVDKYRVKEYLKQIGYPELAAKLYGVYEKADDINWDELPNQFVIKCNHGGGYNIICNDKNSLNKKIVIKQLKKWMREEYWAVYAEPQYKYVEKRILIEEFLGENIHTYKFYCFNGVPKVCYISSNGKNGEYDMYYDYFDMDWTRLNIYLKGHDHYPGVLAKPERFEDMKRIAEELCKKFPFVRIDLYNINGKIYLSEFTFIPTGGYMHLKPDGTDLEWGNWLKKKK